MATSYTNGEAKVKAVLRTCTGFTSTNTTAGAWGILNKGKAANYGILAPGIPKFRWETPTMYVVDYVTVIECWRRYTSDGNTQAALYADVANVINGFMPERLLNQTGSIRDSSITQVGPVEEMWRKGGGPAWLRQKVYVTWSEENYVTFTD